MKSKFSLLLSLLAILTFTSCDQLNDILPAGLTETEIVEGLKSALTVGADSSVNVTSKVDGYLKDEAIKLLLPPEAANVVSTLKQNSITKGLYEATLQPVENNLVTSLNRAAEDAATTAKPILIDAITNISITDGKKILFDGIDTAATNYLRIKTFQSLKTAFAPKVDASLSKPILLNKSANDYWSLFISTYNTIVNNPVASFFNLTPLQNQSLGSYATEKALEGLFYKIKQEEIQIRKDPSARVTDILAKVFGELDI